MHPLLLALALQLRLAGGAPIPAAAAQQTDSLRDIEHAREVQTSFERGRRQLLPWTEGGGDRCDVRIGSLCWWDDGGSAPPPEPPAIAQRRDVMLTVLDSLGARHPADDWIAGARVHYRVEARQWALADSAAASCRGIRWWCLALSGYAAHAGGRFPAADSAFAAALAAMPDTTRCAWRDIGTLLPGDVRDRYEHLTCLEREPVETRYWALSAPRLAASDWKSEFYVRRTIVALAHQTETLDPLGRGRFVDELVLRFGWPTAWSRIRPRSPAYEVDLRIVGHDPGPSFGFAPREELFDSLGSGGNDGWDVRDLHSPARYKPLAVRRVVPARMQIARFRRGDSTLIAAAFAASDDSLRAPHAAVAAALPDGRVFASAGMDTAAGHALLTVPGEPTVAGVDLLDSTTATLARSRLLFAPRTDGGPMRLSDLLLYRYDEAIPFLLDSVLAHSITGEQVTRQVAVGVYWESYGIESDSALQTAVIVERIDHGFFRSARQRLGFDDPDTPIRIHWQDAPPGGAVSSRALSLDLANLAAGRYRISITLSPAVGAPLTSTREVELSDR